MSKSLDELLREADESAPPPPMAARLADQVRARSHARTVRRRTAAVVALPLMVAIVAAALFHTRRPTEQSPVAKSVPLTAPSRGESLPTLAAAQSLRADAALTMSVVHGLRAREQRRLRLTEARERLLQSNVPDSIDSELDRAALTMLDHGDRLRRDLKQVDAAVAAYRRTIELFPQTRWAAVAKKRIEQLMPDARGNDARRSLT
jgi:hypothetical protein